MTNRYQFEVDECDVTPQQRAQLEAFRVKRSKWINLLNGEHVNCISNQVINLLWYSSLFYVLNESRKNDSSKPINNALWDMLFKGYVVQAGTAIRRLVDKDANTGSLKVIVMEMQRNHHLLTRENIVCYDGCPFDPEESRKKYYEASVPDGDTHAIPMEGRDAWFRSEVAHKAFDKITVDNSKKARSNKVDLLVLDRLIAELEKPEIKRVKSWVDKQIAHSDHSYNPNDPEFQPTLNDINESIKTIIQVRQFISTGILYDTHYGGVPTPQYDVFKHLDEPIISEKEMPNLEKYWQCRVDECDEWVAAGSSYADKFLGTKTK